VPWVISLEDVGTQGGRVLRGSHRTPIYWDS
jgi:hypothetical protein